MAKNRPKSAAFKKSQKKRLHRFVSNRCQICGGGNVGGSARNDGDALKPHHILPHSRGGLTVEANCAMLCVACHCKLHAMAANEPSDGVAERWAADLGISQEELAESLNAEHYSVRPIDNPVELLHVYADLCRETPNR